MNGAARTLGVSAICALDNPKDRRETAGRLACDRMAAPLVADLPLVVTREWPWGLAFVRDSAWAEPPARGWVREHPVSAQEGQIVAKILHEVDGEATLEVSRIPPEGLLLVHECDVAFPSGVAVVSDAGQLRMDKVALRPGVWSAAVWMDDVESARRVVISLRRRGNELA
jgi:hypothetical protein